MFWRYGGFANVSTIDTLLEQSDVTLEELLDESDLIQELKQHNAKLLQYLRKDDVLEKLLEYVVAPKLDATRDDDLQSNEKEFEKESSSTEYLDYDVNEDEKKKQRNRYAYVAAEVLSSDNWSICGSLMLNQQILRKFWDFLKTSPPLDPLQAGYFTKVNEALLDRETKEMLNFFKSCEGVVRNMLRHIDSPMIMDLLLKIISLEKAEGGQGIIDWLHGQDLIPMLLSFLSSEHSWTTQTSAGDFLKAIITISANTPQIQQSCIGPNELTRQLVSQPCVEELISYMLKGGNPLTVGVGVIIEVIRKNNSDYDPCIGTEESTPSSRDPIYLGTLLRLFARHIPDFMSLMLTPSKIVGNSNGLMRSRRKELDTAFGGKIEPLGFDRFKICELMAELLHCSNMRLLNEAESEEIFRKRDIKRELLRVEGQFDSSQNGSSIKVNGASQVKKLHIQNVSDDDGFERVSHSGDDETNEYGNFEQPNTLAKNDQNFENESLPPKYSEEYCKSDTSALLSSPTKDISNKIDSLGLEAGKNDSLNCSNSKESLSPEDNIANIVTNEDPKNKKSETYNRCIHTGMNTKEIERNEDEDGSRPLNHMTHNLNEAIVNLPCDTSDHPENFNDKSNGLLPKMDENIEADSEKNGPDSQCNISTSEGHMVMEESGDDNSFLINIRLAVKDYPIVGELLKRQFVEHNVIPTILDFFFRFPWNNFLHNVVYDVVQQVFNGSMELASNRLLAFDLFETGDITMRIVNGQRESDQMTKMRLGYMGHLTLIAEEVVKFTERHPAEFFSETVLTKIMNSDWISYVEVTLAETRERDNAILGGFRPSKPSGGQRLAASNVVGNFGTVLVEPGLNGFGPNEEEFEIAGAEYVTDNQPSASPPPLPSLQINPTRARLQFAARLALHKAEKDEESLTEDDDTGVIVATEAKHRTTLDDGESDDI
ncbi:putative sit4 phosphatase-associated protein [Erysiphe necator]|uniref:Putative sit4 phosphatase-associated protein n=1 Tax=Uncinula necator TaxID=52586 RepID=A0A0B1PH10_UNCNE|nr:putative sit4 phosphatase-associated protein [Erysiphe necator]